MSSPSDSRPFWLRKTLDELTAEEWESLCDGCGRCCVLKLTWCDTGNTAFTSVGCRLLDPDTCRCTDYANRHEKVPECFDLAREYRDTLHLLPQSCAYRRVDEGRPLAWWHPLVSGRSETVHEAGISVAGRIAREDEIRPGSLDQFIVRWYE